MMAVAAVMFVALALLSLRGVRWAYIAFIVMGLAYFPVKVGFHFAPRACELLVGPRLALFSLTNYPHIVHFALFFVISSAQFSDARLSARASFVRAALATLAMGALVELAEGVTGRGHCRLRDLIPDSTGIVVGAMVVFLWRAARQRVVIRRNSA